MKKLLLISLSLLSFCLFAQDYVYHGVKNVDAKVGLNSENKPAGEIISENCYTATVGTRGSWQGCDGLLIVDNNSLRQMVLNDENYSDTNIFTGQVTDMNSLFCNYSSTNSAYTQCTVKEPIFTISNWDVSNVTNMNKMFEFSSSFNQPLNNWDVSNVNNMRQIFRFTNFNQPLNNWNVSNVNDMSYAFSNNPIFNQPLNNWDVSSVTTMFKMFESTNNFNQALNNWNVSNVTNMNGMFQNANVFNQHIHNWDVSSVTDMTNMFNNTSSFNQDISNWCVNQISTKPNGFDFNSGFEGQDALQPNWGTCP